MTKFKPILKIEDIKPGDLLGEEDHEEGFFNYQLVLEWSKECYKVLWMDRWNTEQIWSIQFGSNKIYTNRIEFFNIAFRNDVIIV